jgi:NAD-dependent dihydropyrimidine dehydrogenase PreA subunit
MTYVIAEPCIDVKDKACVEVCPVDCIHGTDADKMLYINPEECIDCGACEPACPVQAIFPEEEVPEKWKSFIAKNYEYYGQTPPAK